jgi:hypothetical protein
MPKDASRNIRQLIERMPQWVRADLSARDAMVRGRAEDALFAMIDAAIIATKTSAAPVPPVDGESTAPTSM